MTPRHPGSEQQCRTPPLTRCGDDFSPTARKPSPGRHRESPQPGNGPGIRSGTSVWATPGATATHPPNPHGAISTLAGEYAASAASWQARPRSPFCWDSSPAFPKSPRACPQDPTAVRRPRPPVPLSSHHPPPPRPWSRRMRRRKAPRLERMAGPARHALDRPLNVVAKLQRDTARTGSTPRAHECLRGRWGRQ